MNDEYLDQEKQYLEAKAAYYEGRPIMEDWEFDELEEQLKLNGSSVVNIIGAQKKLDVLDNKRKKDFHLSPLLSLGKIKTGNDGLPPTIDALKWMDKTNSSLFETSPKYDGNSANVIYINSQLHMVLSRGDGKEGNDITDKLIHQLPYKIFDNDSSAVEIRGEVLIPTDVFEKKYKYAGEKEKKNPRNFVAGILNSDNPDIEVINDLHFIPYEVRLFDENKDYTYVDNLYQWLRQNEFEYLPELLLMKSDAHAFEHAFEYWSNYRENKSIYQLDGFVIKVIGSKDRMLLGDNGHDPVWALAVKFKPKIGTTEIIDIEWKLGKTGAYTPVGILSPVDLDGSVVSKVSLYNLKYITENKVYPGARVTLQKMGDIIPKINSIIKQSDREYTIPTICSYCNSTLSVVDDIHLMCLNVDCKGRSLERFIYGVNALNLDFFGEATIEKIFDMGIKTPFELFDKTKFNRENLISVGFADGRYIDKMLHQLDKIKSVTLEQCLLMLGITGLGKSVSKELAKKLSKIPYSDHGLTKKFFDMFDDNKSPELGLLTSGLSILLNNKIDVIKPKEVGPNKIQTYTLTGSPSNFGFKTKADFEEYASKFGFSHEALTRSTYYLITDDLNSMTSKMTKAKKLGVEIITYQKFIDIYGT